MPRAFLLAWALAFISAFAEDASPGYCRPSQACWPTEAEIKELYASLNPEMNRTLIWKGPPTPVSTWIPAGTYEPLFGVGENMLPLYVNVADPAPCLFGGGSNATEICKMATREAPRNGWQPAFVAWPMSVGHVQDLVKFASKHRLCIAVAGTGGDFQNRHSCDQGMMIRMALMKDIEWDLNDSHGFGHRSVRMGPGHTFAEIHYSGSLQNPSSFIAAGWGQSVGVVGWHLGGGHGPFVRNKGLGIDNILEVELVLSNGTVVTANQRSHADLFWALRGGGGSAWGVIVSITSRAHAAPADGFTDVSWSASGGLCNKDTDVLAEVFVQVLANLSDRWGYVTSGAAYGEKPSLWNLWCGKRFVSGGAFAYLGGDQDPEFQRELQSLQAGLAGFGGKVSTRPSYKNWINHYDDVPITTDQYSNGTTYVGDFCKQTYLIRDEQVGKMTQRVKDTLKRTTIGEQSSFQVYAWQGRNNSMAAAKGATSISPKAQGAEYHFFSPHQPGFDDVSDTSYFNESPYMPPGATWKDTHWGTNYAQLLSIKQKYDPENVFWCQNCVGSDLWHPTKSVQAVLI